MLLNFITKIWNGLGPRPRERVAWVMSAKFTHGVSGVILNKEGRVLLLKHRFWKQQRWGLPGGHAIHGETLGATLRRELREETGMEVFPKKLLSVSTRYGLQSQFFLLAETSSQPEIKSIEIMDARFWTLAELPENLLPSHRIFLGELIARQEWPGLALED